MTAYIPLVSINFDPKKDAANLKQRGVSLAEGDGVLDDPLALTIEDNAARAATRLLCARMRRRRIAFGVIFFCRHFRRLTGSVAAGATIPGLSAATVRPTVSASLTVPMEPIPMRLGIGGCYLDGAGAQARSTSSNWDLAPGPRAKGVMIGTSTPDCR
ncbi:MAG: BrnT family toxin [Alphaproteobacteria bacterium]|nr:BrnT family toxin [Alphaproteobacteria bacterium]